LPLFKQWIDRHRVVRACGGHADHYAAPVQGK
jgi:hypothetical protein